MGYVGIPVAVTFARKGFEVIGVNRSKNKVELINKGICPIEGEEPNLSDYLEQVVDSGNLKATQDYSVIKDAQAILVAVQTPFYDNEPDYSSLRGAVERIGEHLQKGQLVVIESTIAPGTMYGVVKPILELKSGLKAGEDFMLGNCPERVMPGKLLYNIENLDRVIGGIDANTQKAMLELYSKALNGDLYPTDCLTAEVVKTAENAYRDVEIAFANELALICERLNINVYEVRDLVNKSPYRNVHLPGAGVGGHCLPKDSLLLNYGSPNYTAELMLLARRINDSMPHHVVELTRGLLPDIAGKKVAVMGFAYLENSDDTRNTPTLPIARGLMDLGANVVVHDPYVKEFEGINITQDIKKAISGSHCLIISTAHNEYRNLSLDMLKVAMSDHNIVDGRNVFDRRAVEEKGFRFAGIGK